MVAERLLGRFFLLIKIGRECASSSVDIVRLHVMSGTAAATKKRHQGCSEDGVVGPLNSASRELPCLWTCCLGHHKPLVV